MEARRLALQRSEGFFRRTPIPVERLDVEILEKELKTLFKAGESRRLELYLDISDALGHFPRQWGGLLGYMDFGWLSGITQPLIDRIAHEQAELLKEIKLFYDFWTAVAQLEQFVVTNVENYDESDYESDEKRRQAKSARRELLKTWLKEIPQYFNYYFRESEYLDRYNKLLSYFEAIGTEAAEVHQTGDIELMHSAQTSFKSKQPPGFTRTISEDY